MSDITKEQLDTIENVVKKIRAGNYTFGGYTQADIRQEVRIICIEVIRKNSFKGKSALETYLIRACINSLSNMQRKNRLRTTSDCDCQNCKVCVRRNSKDSICNMYSLENVKNETLFSYNDNYNEYEEVLEKIDRRLPPELRPDYLRMRQGEKITDSRKNNIINVIKEIIDE